MIAHGSFEVIRIVRVAIIVTSLGWPWYLDRTITDNDGMNDYYFLLAHAVISAILVQINHVCYSGMISEASIVRPKSGRLLDMRKSI